MAQFWLDNFFTNMTEDEKLKTKTAVLTKDCSDDLDGTSFPSVLPARYRRDLLKRAIKNERHIADAEDDSFLMATNCQGKVEESEKDLVRHVIRFRDELDRVFKKICKKNVGRCISRCLVNGVSEDGDADVLSDVFPHFNLAPPEGMPLFLPGVKSSNGSENNDGFEDKEGGDMKRRRVVYEASSSTGSEQRKEQRDDIAVEIGDLEEELEKLKYSLSEKILFLYKNDPDACKNLLSREEWDVHHWGKALRFLKEDRKIAFAEFVMKEMTCETHVQDQMLEMVRKQAPGFYVEYFVEYDRICRAFEMYLRQLVSLRRKREVVVMRKKENKEKEESVKEVRSEPTLVESPLSPYSPGSPESPPPPPPPPETNNDVNGNDSCHSGGDHWTVIIDETSRST